MPSMAGAPHATSAPAGPRCRVHLLTGELRGDPERPLRRGDRFVDTLPEGGRSPVRQATESRQALPADLLYPRGISRTRFVPATSAQADAQLILNRDVVPDRPVNPIALARADARSERTQGAPFVAKRRIQVPNGPFRRGRLVWRPPVAVDVFLGHGRKAHHRRGKEKGSKESHRSAPRR